jgi:endonuclease III related protein
LTRADRFEVIMGAVLTQNTAWTNASQALEHLRREGVRLPADVLELPLPALARLVRSSGYFNQKAKKLKSLAARFAARGALGPAAAPTREGLLAEWGVGPETADSILLYAFHVPVFVVDAYTRRILARVGLTDGSESYDEIQRIFHASLEPSAPMYNEYHALIVEHAKAHCRTRPACASCPVSRCRYRDSQEA